MGKEKVALEVERLCEWKKIAEAIETFWHLREAACERMQVLPFWANAKAFLFQETSWVQVMIPYSTSESFKFIWTRREFVVANHKA